MIIFKKTWSKNVKCLVKQRLIMNMQAEYPKKTNPPRWDPVHIEYPVRKIKEASVSSKKLCHQWREPTEVLRDPKGLYPEVKEYSRDYNVTNGLTRSQSTLDFEYKVSETIRFNKHLSSTEQHYIYPPSRQLTERSPSQRAHGTTEMKASYQIPQRGPSFVTDKDQFKHIASLNIDPAPVEPSWHKDLEPLDTTHEGYEKYLDPYLTTSRLHHRPYTAEQLSRISNANNVVTYHTLNDTPWVRRPKPSPGDFWLPRRIPKSIYDKEKFKQGCREIRSHNPLLWVPGSFRTEARDNYQTPTANIQDLNDFVQNHYKRTIAKYPTNTSNENMLLNNYCTENRIIGSKKPICATLNQCVEKNKRLEHRSSK